MLFYMKMSAVKLKNRTKNVKLLLFQNSYKLNNISIVMTYTHYTYRAADNLSTLVTLSLENMNQTTPVLLVMEMVHHRSLQAFLSLLLF